jgi:hypothetical protein
MFRINKMFFAGFLLLGVLRVCAWSAVLPDSAALLGPDTIFMASVNNVRQVLEQAKKTRLYGLYRDPSMQSFFEKLKTQLEPLVQEQDNELLSLMVRDKVYPTGRVLLAVNVPQGKPLWVSESSVLGLVQWGEHSQQVRELFEKGFQKEIEQGAHRSVQRYRDYEIITMLQPAEMPEPTGPAETLEPAEPSATYYCFFEDSLLVSDNLETLQFVLAQLSGARSRTLADEADYQRSRRAVGPVYDVECYVNLKGLLERAFLSGDKESSGEMQKELSALGVDGVSGLSMAIAVAPSAETNISVKAMLTVPGPRRGLLKMFELVGKPFRPPVFVDPQAGQIAYVNLDIPAAGEELFRMLSSISPMFAAMLNNPITPPQADGSPGVILKEDVLDTLGDQLISAGTVQADPTQESGFREETLMAVAVRNAERLNRAVAAMHSQFLAAGRPELQREYLGYTLYSIPLGEMFIAESGTQTPELALAVTQTHLLWGAQPAVEKAIQRLNQPRAESLGEKAWYRRAASRIPSEAGLGAMENMQLVGQPFWALLKSGKWSDLVELEIENDKARAIIKAFEALPDFERVRSYFGINVSWLRTGPDGFLMEAIDLPAGPPAN